MEYMPVSEVYNMDCMDYMREIPDGFFHLAVVDPPYGLSPKSTRGSGKLKNRTLNRGDMRWDVRPPAEYFDELFRVSCNQVIWGGNYFPLPPTRCFVCWDKKQVWENFSQCEMAWTSFDRPARLVSISNRGAEGTGGKYTPRRSRWSCIPTCTGHFPKRDTVFLTLIWGAEAAALQHGGWGLTFMPLK